ncbi:MAG TPA: potassium channel family protein [Acidimicrobiia bacterium]|jgi:hypothetical protein|nr:potassium channel family protein [Acidimicrobiia bacterium]
MVGEVERQPRGVRLRERYGLVLSLILVSYLLAGFEENLLMILVNSLLWGTLLLATLWSPGLPATLRRVGVGATVVFFLTAISMGLVASDLAHGLRLLMLAVAQLAALLAVIYRIAQHKVVTFQTVMGGIAAYALIAFVMAAVFRGLSLVTGSALLSGVGSSGDYIYYSFVTLTTVGYGDITPATDLAKRLAVIEMFVGQVFLITLVARLVSLWGKPLERAETN